MWGKFFLLTYTLGPAAAIPYAIGEINLSLVLTILFISYTAPLPIMFFILDKLHYETSAKQHILKKILHHPVKKAKDKKVMNRIYNSFVGKWGYIGHYLGIFTLAIAFGFLWAAIIAYLMKLPRLRSYIAIGLGNLVGILLWTFTIVQTKGFIKPKWVIITVLLVTFTLFLYGEIHEIKILRKIKQKQKELLSKLKDAKNSLNK